MEKTSVKVALKEADFKLRPLHEPELRAIVRAMLTLSTKGVLVTDLNHLPIGCNGVFGRIFHVDPSVVPELSVEELRGYVYPRLADPEKWVRNLDEVYSDPMNVYSDEIHLGGPPAWIRRSTTPLVDGSGVALGRLWTFEDITKEKARSERRAIIQRLSTFHHPDPRVVYQEVIDSVANLYDSTSLLSIQEGDRMVFRAKARPAWWIADVPSNFISDSFCQLVLEQEKMAIVQNATLHPKVCEMVAVKMGIILRYLGVPLLTPNGKMIGTLCIIDGKSDEILSEEDAEFMAIMANRISVELERERLYESRMQDQRQALERQAAELSGTRAVLQAMNESAALGEKVASEADLISRLELLLKGTLGCEVVSLHVGEPQYESSRSRTWKVEDTVFSMEFWRPSDCFSEEYLEAHVSAIADQAALNLADYRLKRALLDAHAELRVAQGRLVQAEKLGVVGTLAASVAHDIRNIMASIALEAASSNDPVEALEKVRAQVERFSVLSHRLLSYVKPTYMAREAVDLNLVATRAVELLDPQIRASKISLTQDFASSLPRVESDPTQVEHLFVNLILNALQAVNRSGGSLAISSRFEEQRLEFRFRDNGRGMSPEILERIFEPFYSSRQDGFGLGLFSCKRIAKEHGWRLSATSTLGEGSEFTLVVPLGGAK